MPPALRRIVFWQPIDSPHQDAFLEAVAEQLGRITRELPPSPATKSAAVRTICTHHELAAEK
jgi:hypothetical protein